MALQRASLVLALCGLFSAARGISQSVVGSIAGSFDVSLSGSAVYTVPIRVAPGTSGMQPRLSLIYDSQALSGPLGAGWAIGGLSVITRGPKNVRFDGIPDGVKLAESDALYLDGQRLVAIAISGSGAGKTVEYRKATDDQTRIVETGADFASAKFVVSTKGGIFIEFDSVPGTAPDQNRGDIRFGDNSVLLRAESKVYDTSGNYIDFYYVVNGAGNYDIKTIRYTGHQSDPARPSQDHAPYAAVEFTYDKAPRNAKSYVAGQALVVDTRLSAITSRVSKNLDDVAGPWLQVARYTCDYQDRDTANRFVLTTLHQFGEDDSQLTPTTFTYASPAFGWADAPYSFPAVLATHDQLAAGYRFAHVSPLATLVPDLLYSTQAGGQLEAFAFQNNGNKWSALGDGFRPPVPFSSADGKDLGVILADVSGDGRSDILQSNDMTGQPRASAAYMAGATGFEAQPGFVVPFAISKDGIRIANYKLEKWSGGPGPDLLYESDGQTGFLANTATGWKPDIRYIPPVDLGGHTWTADVDCSGKPSLVAAVKSAAGIVGWKVYKYGPLKWEEVTSTAFAFPFPAETNPEAVRLIQIDQTACVGLIVATGENGGLHNAYQATPTGWQPIPAKNPTFDLVDSTGRASKAIITQIRGSGYSDVLAHRVFADGSETKFLAFQTASGWEMAPTIFAIPILSDVRDTTSSSITVADFTGDGKADIAVPSNSRQTFGQLFEAHTDGFVETPDYAPPVAFARKDHQDQGVRMVDLNGDGLPDLLVSKTGGAAPAAWINTGAGWNLQPGLTPPVSFAGDDVSGSPAQFVDVDGDGFVDLLYAYRDKSGTTVTKLYRNVAGINGSRKWSDTPTDDPQFAGLIPPSAFPFAADKIGDLGVRFADLAGTGRPYMLVGFQPPGAGAAKVLTAFKSDGSKWIPAPEYAPPVPFVAQIASLTDPSRDLSVQLVDVNSDGLPDLVASYHDPNNPSSLVQGVWLNTGTGWAKSSIAVPVALDTLKWDSQQGLQWEKNASIQWADVNGDGLPDIIYSRREGGTNESSTYLGTGQGWSADPTWQLPLDALVDRGGDPGLRIIDVNGDGYADLIFLRQNADGTITKGLYVNNGIGWIPKDSSAVPEVPFVDKDGNDLGVRLVDVDGRGLVDLIQAYNGDSQQVSVKINQVRRSDVIQSIDIGYGSKTALFYQSLLEPLPPDLGSTSEGIRGEFNWQRVYEPVQGNISYPTVAPIPATYVVRRAIISEGSNTKVAYSYRYGGYRADALSKVSLGFAWRDSVNENNAVLSHVELSQDVNNVGRSLNDQSCWLDFSKVPSGPAIPSQLCSLSGKQGYEWVDRLNETKTDWKVEEGPVGGGSVPEKTLRQISLSGSVSQSYELDGQVLESRHETYQYDEISGGQSLTERHMNVRNSTTTWGDGSQVDTVNTYADDSLHWHLGRLATTSVTKTAATPKSGVVALPPETRIAEFTYDPESGLLTAETIKYKGSTRQFGTVYKRDPFGNISERQIRASGVAPSDPTTYKFDSIGRFLISTTNPLKHTTTQIMCSTTGLPCQVTDANDITTSYDYDGFGRLVHLHAPTGTDPATGNDTSITASTEYLALNDLDTTIPVSGINAASAVRSGTTDESNPLPYMYRLLDSQGRTVRLITDSFTKDATKHRYILRDTIYDAYGRVAQVSLPYEVSKAPSWTTVTRDVMGRVTSQVSPSKGVVTTTYAGQVSGGLVTTVTDTRPRRPTKAITVTDMRQLITSTVDTRGGKTTYTYDSGNRPLTVADPLGKVTRYTYDLFGNRQSISDPDVGLWSYEYDALGHLIKQLDGSNGLSVVTTIEYDALGRVKRQTRPGEAWTWTYDGQHGVGKIASVTDDAGKYLKRTTYDQVGRVDNVAVTIGSSTYTTAQTYDSFGRVAKITYPNSLTINNVFDAKGILTKVSNAETQKPFWRLGATDAFGHVTNASYANGVNDYESFDPLTGRPMELETLTSNNSVVIDLKLRYDLAGDLRHREEVSQKQIEDFSYDGLDRLTSLARPDGSKEEYAYDGGGRITQKSGIKYVYADTNGGKSTGCGKLPLPAHAVLRTVVGQEQHTFGYDCHGNMTTSNGDKYTYAPDGRFISAQHDPTGLRIEQSDVFDYGPSGQRYRERAVHGFRVLETISVGNYQQISESRTNQAGQKASFVRYRWYLNNGYGTFAVVERSHQEYDAGMAGTIFHDGAAPVGPSAVDVEKVWYLHKDQLGSVLAITDEKGEVRSRFWYDPWGVRSSTNADPVGVRSGERLEDSWSDGFLGQEHLGDFELIHLNGRMYDPQLGMFTSPDPLNESPTDSQLYNPYSYSRNNPLRFTDPSGYCFMGCFWQAPGKVISDVANGIVNGVVAVGNAFADAGKWVGQNWRQVVIVAAVVVVTVATAGSGGPAAASLGTAILSGMAAGATAGGLSAALYGGSLDDVLMGALKGGVIGGLSGGAFYGVGSLTAGSGALNGIGGVAGHGLVGGARELAYGGNFWQGFESGALTKTSSLVLPTFDSGGLNTARAALVGGAAAAIGGGNFANGAVTGAFSYAFNDAMHPPIEDAIYPSASPLDAAILGIGAFAEAGIAYVADMFVEEGLIVEGEESVITESVVSDGNIEVGRPASSPQGRLGQPIEYEPGTNAPTTIDGRDFTGHSLDQMQGRGIPPSAVENTIQQGNSAPGNVPGRTVYYEPVNNLSAVTDSSSGRVITVRPGPQ
jgi:RHS repeat-associated protein